MVVEVQGQGERGSYQLLSPLLLLAPPMFTVITTGMYWHNFYTPWSFTTVLKLGVFLSILSKYLFDIIVIFAYFI